MSGKFTTLVDMLESSLRAFPDKPVMGIKLRGHYSWITYREFGTRVDHCRAGLAARGLKEGERTAIISNNRIEWAVACYATYQLGAAFAPMYESQSPDDWRFILNDCQPSILIVSNEEIHKHLGAILDDVKSIREVIILDAHEHHHDAISFEHLMDIGRKNPTPPLQIDPKSMSGLIYTSGTTGKPKGVMLSHGNIISNINAMHEILPITPGEVSLSFLPWAHSFGQNVELHGMISAGGALGLAERVDTIIANLSEVRPTVLFSVPRVFNKIYDGLNKKMAHAPPLKKKLFYAGLANSAELRRRKERGLGPGLPGILDIFFDRVVFSKVRSVLGGRLKYAFSGGAALSKEVAEFIDNLHITVYEGYGLSETSPIITANYPGAQRIGSVGKPIPGVRVVIDTNVEGGDPDVGEIINYGPNTMMGYFNRPEETARVMTADGGFRTGDLGRMEDGFLYITGRVKEQYKLENGKYVVPAPLEEQLTLSPYILQAMIHGENRPFNIALIVPDFDAIREWAAAHAIASTDPEALCKNPEVRALIQKEIEKYSKEWKGYERPKAFALLPDEWSVDNDMLTPKLSLKRRNVVKKYEQSIEELYR